MTMTMTRSDIMKCFGELIHKAAQGNNAAVEFVVDSLLIAHTWDDLIDKDRAVLPGEINGAFYLALVKIPLNPFYQKHQERLALFVQRCIADWLIATKWEQNGTITQQQAEIAYITRSSYTQVITEVALICGGFDHAFDIQETVRLTMHDEGVGGYLKSLGREV